MQETEFKVGQSKLTRAIAYMLQCPTGGVSLGEANEIVNGMRQCQPIEPPEPDGPKDPDAG